MTLCPRCSFTMDGPLHRDFCPDAQHPASCPDCAANLDAARARSRAASDAWQAEQRSIAVEAMRAKGWSL